MKKIFLDFRYRGGQNLSEKYSGVAMGVDDERLRLERENFRNLKAGKKNQVI